MRTFIRIALTAVLLSAASQGHAVDLAGAGKDMYLRYCAACHGSSGRGDGPVSGALGEKPRNLTTLARDNGGTFPEAEVIRAIDGTETVRAHGVSEMPVWGEVLAGGPEWSPLQYATARGKIILIANHLRSIQTK